MFSVGNILFVVLSLFVLVTAVFVIRSRNIVRSAYSLVFCFLGVAGIYALLGFGFLALAQVLVYGGAIAVLIIFAILAVAQPNMDETNPSGPRRLTAGLTVAALAGFSTYLILITRWKTSTAVSAASDVAAIGELFLGRYAVPLEAAAILLLVALVGAIILVREEK